MCPSTDDGNSHVRIRMSYTYTYTYTYTTSPADWYVLKNPRRSIKTGKIMGNGDNGDFEERIGHRPAYRQGRIVSELSGAAQGVAT